MAPLIIAHRGDSAHRPENTLASFASALEIGAPVVEFDVQMTRDGHVVVLHDPTVDRTTDGQGRILDLSLAEARRLTAGYPERFGRQYEGERIPTLSDALALMRDRTRVMIEIKTDAVTADADDGVEGRTLYEIRRAGMAQQAVVISFDRRALVRCRALAAEVRRGHVFYREAVLAMMAGAQEAGCDLVMPEKGDLSDALRDEVRQAGLKLATWVVDDPAELAGLARFDLSGIGTNRPGVLLEALQEA